MSDDAAGRLARVIEARGLTEPARLMVDAHRPLAPLLSDLGAAIGPIVRVIGGAGSAGIGDLVADDDALDRLGRRLDELERSRAEPR